MKPEEIRQMSVDSDLDRRMWNYLNEILREMTAQLAELNEFIREIGY
jgi:aminoglycoside/choline kinase family phosphotransferase